MNKKDSGNKILSKFLSISVGSWIAMLIGFLSTPVITRLLSPEEFGKVSLFLLVVEVLTAIILFGSDQSFIRFFYEEQSNKRPVLLRKSLYLPLLLYAGIALLFLCFYQIFSRLLFSESSLYLIGLLLVYVLLRIFSTWSSLVIRMQQKGKLFSLIQVLNKLIEFIGILVFAYLLGDQYEVLIYAQITFMVIVTIIAISIEFHFWDFSKQKGVKLDSTFYERIKYGFPLMITLLMTLAFQSVDRITIRIWAGYNEVGLYFAAFKIIALLNMLQINFTAFWTPLSYEKYKKNPKQTQFFHNAHQIVAYSMLMIAVIVLMSKGIIIALLGAEYQQAEHIVPFLVFIPLMYTVSEISVIGINFYKKTGWHIFITIFVFAVNLLGNILLVPVIGAVGAAVSTGLSYILFYMLRTYFSTRYYKVDYGTKKFSISVSCLVMYAFYATFYKDGVVSFLLGITLLVVITLIYYQVVNEIINYFKKWINKGNTGSDVYENFDDRTR
ncbi:lipopolysaccharide biosynthesis protein [Listeria kieliensis]|uniref:lipopolysaccharide biosynthesis protein n=1 Tax=Listeria kieliensis TaxID=1621700 RepID=UPI000E2159E0|nr:oligosaccharide flippase family protein [Listeria kieliensis]